MLPLPPQLPPVFQMFADVKVAVEAEITTLEKENTRLSRNKAHEIKEALGRLFSLIASSNPELASKLNWEKKWNKINPEEISNIDLSTTKAMLDARIGEWQSAIELSSMCSDTKERAAGFYKQDSLTTTLSVASNNPFNFLTSEPIWGPLWGIDRSLENVEKKLGICY